MFRQSPSNRPLPKKMNRGKRQSYWKGLVAEYLAMGLLMGKGYRCLARRYKTPYGEIDLVMAKGDYLVAVEVKARKTKAAALESLRPHQQQRICRALQAFQARHEAYHPFCLRFDFVLLMGLKMCHIKGAWR